MGWWDDHVAIRLEAHVAPYAAALVRVLPVRNVAAGLAAKHVASTSSVAACNVERKQILSNAPRKSEHTLAVTLEALDDLVRAFALGAEGDPD